MTVLPDKEFAFGGLVCRVFTSNPDINALPQAVLFFLHGRKESVDKYYPLCRRLSSASPSLHILALEQRNHGSRQTDPVQNEAWPENPRHHSDMYAMQVGTARDVVFLMDMLPLLDDYSAVTRWGVAGVSLGGHAALLAVAQQADGQSRRLSLCISIVGCGDYAELMQGRLASLQRQVAKRGRDANALPEPADVAAALARVVPATDPVARADKFAGVTVVLCAGGRDRLVPHAANASLVARIRSAGADVVEVVDEEAGHTCSQRMEEAAADAVRRWA